MTFVAAIEAVAGRTSRLRTIGSRLQQSPIIREIAGTFGTRIVLIAAGLVASVLTTRMLGPTGRGIYAVAAAASALCIQFGNLGLHASNTYTVARNPQSLRPLIANSLLVSAAVGVSTAVIAWVAFTLAPSVIALPIGMRVLAIVSVPLGLAYLLLQNLLIGTGRIRQYNTLEVILRVGGVAGLLLLVATRSITPFSAFGVSVAASLIGVLGAMNMLPRLRLPELRFHSTVMASSLRYGAKAYASALFAYVTLRFDLLMVEHYRGTAAAGYYSIAAAYGDLVYLLPTVVGTILFPRLAALPTDAERWRLARKAIVGLSVIMLAGVAAAALMAPVIVRVLYGDRFVSAIPAIMWLMPGMALLSVNTVFMNYFASMGMPPITIIAPAVAAVSNIAMNTVLIPNVGIVGASMASSIAYGIMLLSSVTYVMIKRGARA